MKDCNGIRTLNQWVNWNGDKKPTPGIRGQLLTYDEACRRDSGHIGFVFTESDPYLGIDIDEITELAQELLSSARERGAYVERSPSGRGWHIIGHGKLARGVGKGKVDPGVEAYSQGRYFTVTGQGEGSVDVDIQALADRLWTLAQYGEGEGEGQRWDADRHQGALDALDADCGYDQWIRIGMALHAAGAPLEAWTGWSATGGEKFKGPEDCASHWRSFRGDGGVTLATLLAMGREAGWAGPVDEFEDLGPADSADRFDDWLGRLAIDPALFSVAPPPRVWTWESWIPEGVVTGLAGAPGTSKSTLALMLCVLYCVRGSFLGCDLGAEGRGAVFITVEDDGDELRRRLQAICRCLCIDPEELRGLLTLVPAINATTALVHVDKHGHVSATEKLTGLRDGLRARGAGLCVLDLANDFWSGNENSRGEVTAFVRAFLGRVAVQCKAALLILAHLNKLGQLSGSTAWEGSFRSSMVMSKRGEHLLLDRPKANYAPPLEQAAVLRWQHGCLWEVSREELEEGERGEHLEAMDPGHWYGVRALMALPGWPRRQHDVRTVVERLRREGRVEWRERGGNDQWSRVE